MKSKNVSIGFSNRRYHKFRNIALAIGIPLSYLIPFLLLLFIDISKKLQVLIPFALFSPVLQLAVPLQIWREYAQHFDLPTLRTCWRWLCVEKMRGFQHNPNAKKSHVLQDILIVTLFFSTPLICLWQWTKFVSFLYVAVLLMVFSVKALIRRSRPPAIRLLGSSSYDATRLQLKLTSMINPSLVASGLHHRNATAPVSGALSPLTSVRTVEYKEWQEMILSLMGICKTVIIDARRITDAVQFEIDSAIKLLDLNQVFFVGKDIESVPSSRCFSEDELLKQLESRFDYASRSIHRASRCTVYEDRQNGYFRFTPPEGWCFTEYSDPRTKVVFFHPTIPEIKIRFIVSVTVAQPGTRCFLGREN